jgi:hypothetical protein
MATKPLKLDMMPGHRQLQLDDGPRPLSPDKPDKLQLIRSVGYGKYL